MPKIHVLNRDAVLDCPSSTAILDAALDAGVDYPFGCQSGICGACKTRLISGEVDLSDYSGVALSDEERRSGLILACRALPRNDCIIAVADGNDSPHHPVRTVVGRVIATERATHDILIVRLGLLASEEPLHFSAGQFAQLAFPGVPSREYSMANRPGDEGLTFHIRHIPGGVVSSHVHRADIVGELVTVRGPFGISQLRQGHTGPILAAAGGSGLAPILSIVETALQLGTRQRIALYFGARAERDLYLVDHFEALARKHPNLEYVPVLSNVERATARRAGFLADAIRKDHSDLRGWKAYIAGPPPMVDTVTTAAISLGIHANDCHTDPFFTTADRLGPDIGAQRRA